MRKKVYWMLIGVFCVVFVSILAFTQETEWETRMAGAVKAYQEDLYKDAERALLAALKEAEHFGPEDPRLATSLNNLGVLYKTQGKYKEAESFYKRSLSIDEKVLGADHPDVTTGLNNLALFYKAQERFAEATPLLERSTAINDKALRY